VIAGLFVGGASRRMGGAPKGLLRAPPEPGEPPRTIAARTVALARACCDEVVLVGRAEAYGQLGLEAIEDAALGAGPLAGLVALLERARGTSALALACDMPYLSAEMLARLASFAPEAAAVAPRDAGVWSPLFARYDPGKVLGVARAKLAAGEGRLWAVLDAVDARELPLATGERARLRDWDEPSDIDDAGSREGV
jgi:molybdopterin-guanine dinucleotide biosynthesis protein A